jgi:hypothetical protein
MQTPPRRPSAGSVHVPARDHVVGFSRGHGRLLEGRSIIELVERDPPPPELGLR